MGKCLATLLVGAAFFGAATLIAQEVYCPPQNNQYNWAYIGLTTKQQPSRLGRLYLQKKERVVKEITVKRGKPVYIFDSCSAAAGIKSTRVYINGFLKKETLSEERRDKTFPGCIRGFANGRGLDTTEEEHFNIGENTLTLEATDAKGRVFRDKATVIVKE